MLPDGYRSNAPKTHSKIGEYLTSVDAPTCSPGLWVKGFYHRHKSLFVLSIRSHEEFQVRKKEVIKRDEISLAEVQKRQNGVSSGSLVSQ